MVVNAAHALAAAVLEEFDRRGTWAADGALSGAGWAASRTTTARAVLAARARAGAVLRLLPSCEGPARAGRLSPEHLGALARCARRHRALAERDEDVLVGQALALDGRS